MQTTETRCKTGLLTAVCVAALSGLAGAALTTNELPQIQPIYGGRIQNMDVIEPAGSTNIVRLFVSTESANSVFYADVDHTVANPFATNIFSFHVVPDLSAQANRGTVNGIAGHPESGRLFVTDDAADGGLLSCTMASNSLITNISAAAFSTVLIENSVLLTIGSMGTPLSGSNMLFFGTLNTNGILTTNAPISYGSTNMLAGVGPVMLINPSNNCVYIMEEEGLPGIQKSSTAYNALTAATTFSTIALPAAASAWTGQRLGIGPDGRLFIAGASTSNKMIIYSDDDGGSWGAAVDTGVAGTGGPNIETVQITPGNYLVFFGTAISTNNGADGSWSTIPRDNSSPPTTHANDGTVKADPINNQFAYMTTDQGVGVSTNTCLNIFEIDQGLEAVQIKDYDMTAAKDVAWTASKSGLRHGTGSWTNLHWTPDGIFPLNDGSPYASIAIDKDDTSGNTVYAANNKIYKTTDGGTNWTKIWDIEGNTNGFQNLGEFSALVASGQTVVAGFYDQEATYGGLLVSSDGGSNWSQWMSNVDVNDVLLTTNGVLVAVAYDSATGTGGIFIVTSTTITHDLPAAVSICSLAPDSIGGVYASGQDTNYAVKVYYRSASGSGTPVSTLGLPTSTQEPAGRGPVMTVGVDSNTNDLPIIAAGYSLYYLPAGGTTWQTSPSLTYPDGTQINVLYWDDLMVGTSEGLYGQNIVPTNISQNFIMTGDYDGDSKADPALYRTDTGNWYVKLSSMGYGLVTLSFGGTGYQAVNGDFDGDGKADPAVYQAITGTWYVQLSGGGYTVVTLTDFGGVDYAAVTGDYDGDGLTDPAICGTASGDWQVAMSSLNYGLASASGFGGTGYTTVQENYDSDNRFDAAVYNNTNGNWTVLMSASSYITSTLWGFGGTGYAPVSGDFDGDGFADPAIYQESTGDWQVKLSSQQYAVATLDGFGGSGTIVAAADYDGDGQADPIYLDESTGVWHVKLSASGYAEATADSGYTP